MAWTLLMAVARRLIEGDAMVRSGVTFPGCQSLYLVGSQVHGKTLGIVGMGKIGLDMARRAKGFNMRVLFCKRTRDQETEREFARAKPLDIQVRFPYPQPMQKQVFINTYALI